MSEILTSERKEEYIKELFPDGEPLIFKLLIEDAIQRGRDEAKGE